MAKKLTATKKAVKGKRKVKAEPVTAPAPVEWMKGYKGFDPDFKCRDLQYEVGKEYEEEKAALCHAGFHFCENPLDVFSYYPPADGALNRFAQIEAAGVSPETSDDTKRAATQLKISAEIGLPGLIKAGVEYIISKATDTVKETGDWSVAANTGYQSVATNTGDRSAAKVEGKESIAMASGIQGKAAGAIGCWLVLAEWEESDECEWHIKSVKSAKVDGEKIKADVFYRLEKGKFVEAD